MDGQSETGVSEFAPNILPKKFEEKLKLVLVLTLALHKYIAYKCVCDVF